MARPFAAASDETRHGGEPFVGVSIRSDTLSQPALVSELGGIANDLGRFGVALAIRVDR